MENKELKQKDLKKTTRKVKEITNLLVKVFSFLIILYHIHNILRRFSHFKINLDFKKTNTRWHCSCLPHLPLIHWVVFLYHHGNCDNQIIEIPLSLPSSLTP